MTFGVGEIVVVGIIIAIILSASRMTTLGNALGKFVYSFRKASQGDGFVDAKSAPKATRFDQKEEDAQLVDDGKPKP